MITEMIKLINLCAKANIPFELTEDNFFGKSTPHLYYPSYKNHLCSVICHDYSYGGKEGKLEILGLTDYFVDGWDNDNEGDVIGWLEAEEVFKVFQADDLFRNFFK